MGQEGGGSWLCGTDAPGIRISNKKPKIFVRFATNRGRVCGGGGRREGEEGMRGGRKKDLAEGPRGL